LLFLGLVLVVLMHLYGQKQIKQTNALIKQSADLLRQTTALNDELTQQGENNQRRFCTFCGIGTRQKQ
jgi:hypothetical protein